MSTLDDQANQAVDAETSEAEETTFQINDQGKGSGGYIILFFILGFVASLIVGWVIFPKLLYSQRKQPVEFNHALHNGEVDEECESCHFRKCRGKARPRPNSYPNMFKKIAR
jgi:hypothetical protein